MKYAKPSLYLLVKSVTPGRYVVHCQDPETSDVYMKLQIASNFILYDRIAQGHMHEHVCLWPVAVA